MNLTETKDGVILNIFVKPKSKKFEVIVEDDEIIIHITEEPTKGKVNKEIIKELTKLFQTQVGLVSGATSRQKTLMVHGLNKNEVSRILAMT